MLFHSLLVLLFVSSVISHGHIDEKRQELVNKNENELVTVDLKKKDGSKDIKLIVQLRIHLIDGKVHLHGRPLKYGIVHSVHMRVTMTEIEKGIKKDARLAPVHVRVLVLEDPIKKTLIVEEEFLTVEDYEVTQIVVKRVTWESLVRKHDDVKMENSKIYKCNKERDHHMYFGQPRLPEHGLKGGEDNKELYEGRRHHKHHPHGFKKVKCWYKHLSLTSKICLFAVGFLGLITLTVCCSICIKKRQNRKQTLQIATPMDDSIVVDDDEKKAEKLNEEKYSFHFELDNSVVVDDKKVLIE